jgi:uncharacterized integral membrane protein (TIGR00697 family)
MERIVRNIISIFKTFSHRLNEAVFVTKNQYRLRLLHCYISANNQVVAVVQVVIKRVKAKFSVRYLASNNRILEDIHPVNACKIAFIANLENEIGLESIPEYVKIASIPFSIIKQKPFLKIISETFHTINGETSFRLSDMNSNHESLLTANELIQNHSLLYALGSQEAARVGISASNDYLKKTLQNNIQTSSNIINQPSKYFYYHILCICYVTLVLAGMSIVRRMFPFHLPFTDLVVPFGGGILFFPITFCIQDITTEVYGFNAARQMILLSLFSILFYVFYTQLVIHLPNAEGTVYSDNSAFSIVFNTQPRQFIALLVSLFAGSIINDFFISKSKVILAGQYLWARLLGSTMIGEAVLQVVGGVIGFSDKLAFNTQLLPNMLLAYGYKILWCGATIPLIYIISNFLKKKEGIDVFDYDVNYNPFKFTSSSGKNITN